MKPYEALVSITFGPYSYFMKDALFLKAQVIFSRNILN